MFRVGKILTRNCKNNSRSFMLETMNELEEVLIHDLEIAVERAITRLVDSRVEF